MLSASDFPCRFGWWLAGWTKLVSSSGRADAFHDYGKQAQRKMETMLSSTPGTISKRMIGQSDSTDATQLALQRLMWHMFLDV